MEVTPNITYGKYVLAFDTLGCSETASELGDIAQWLIIYVIS
jgi:hypothetical protein